MTKNEALKKCIDGAKVVPAKGTEVEYIYFDRQTNRFKLKWVGSGDVDTFNGDGWVNSDWQIVPEYVDFAKALKAYRNSATIKSVTGEKYSLKREDEGLCVNLKEIEGKWLILEDE